MPHRSHHRSRRTAAFRGAAVVLCLAAVAVGGCGGPSESSKRQTAAEGYVKNLVLLQLQSRARVEHQDVGSDPVVDVSCTEESPTAESCHETADTTLQDPGSVGEAAVGRDFHVQMLGDAPVSVRPAISH